MLFSEWMHHFQTEIPRKPEVRAHGGNPHISSGGTCGELELENSELGHGRSRLVAGSQRKELGISLVFELWAALVLVQTFGAWASDFQILDFDQLKFEAAIHRLRVDRFYSNLRIATARLVRPPKSSRS